MRKNRIVSWRKILFELRMIAGNPFTNFFGVGFPIFLACIIARSVVEEIPDTGMAQQATTVIFLSLGAIIPLATVLMGYAVSRSVEIEKGISERMYLFGISPMETVLNRILAQLVFMIGAFAVYFTVAVGGGFLLAPNWTGVVIYVLCMLALTILLFALGHGIAGICRKYGLTYMVAMMIYFAIMVLSGMMGIENSKFPAPMRVVSRLLPTTFLNHTDFVSAWLGKSYNPGPLLQAFLFMMAFSGIVLFCAVKREGK